MLITTSPPPSTMSSTGASRPSAPSSPLTIAIHGGAGTITSDIPPALQTAYRARLRASLHAGWAVLQQGGTALDAVCASVKVLEDSPLFNAGKGAVFTKAGKVECEASVMLTRPVGAGDSTSGLPALMHGNAWFDRGCPAQEAATVPATGEKAKLLASEPELAAEQGFDTRSIPATRRGAAATLVSHTKNPILLARTLYLLPTAAPHVLLSGLEAEQIGWSRGTTKVDPKYYWTRKRWLEHRRGLGLPDDDDEEAEAEEVAKADREEDAPPPAYGAPSHAPAARHPDQAVFEQHFSGRDGGEFLDLPKGTVGACAIDAAGRLAVATSTGGKTNKSDGRIGDTPSMGAGFWAERFAVTGDTPAETKNERAGACLRCLGQCFGCFTLHLSTGGRGREDSSDVERDVDDKADDWAGSTGVAVSGTGDGDYFLRGSFASLVAHRMRFRGESAAVAGQRAVEELGSIEGVGGAIVLDTAGRATFPMNSNTMNRALMTNTDGPARARVALFQHEELA